MSKPRKDILREDAPARYSITTRCVRRAWLLGLDKETGQNNTHRMVWVEDLLKFLVGIFTVEVQSYAVMDDHVHLVLWVDPKGPQAWSAEEVARRWCQLCPPKPRRGCGPVELTPEFLRNYLSDPAKEKKLRWRLGNLSWFMAKHNERLARRANAEDKCTGRFWQGRFHATRSDDPGATLTAMVYADLNPIRATKAQTPEESDHTSVQDRIVARQGRRKLTLLGETPAPAPTASEANPANPPAESTPSAPAESEPPRDGPIPDGETPGDTESRSHGEQTSRATMDAMADSTTMHLPESERALQLATARREALRDAWLRPFAESPEQDHAACLPIPLDRYLELVDYAGRMIRENKRGAIPAHLAPILQRLDLDLDNWLDNVRHFRRRFFRVAGKIEHLVQAAQAAGRKWFRGHAAAAALYRHTPASA